MMSLRIGRPLLTVLLCLGGVAMASEPDTKERITLACGGIGADESSRMLALEKAHALLILFARADGAYLAGIPVRIDDPLKGLGVERTCGPIGLVDVPVSGRYRVVAQFEGRTLEQWVELKPQGGSRLVLRW